MTVDERAVLRKRKRFSNDEKVDGTLGLCYTGKGVRAKKALLGIY